MLEVLELVRWPLTVVVLGFGGMLLYKRQVSSLLGRTKKVGGKGVTFAQAQPSSPTEDKAALEEIMGSYDNQLLLEQEENIRKDIVARGLDSPDATEKALVRTLAALQLLVLFAELNRQIFRGQLNFLTYVNSQQQGVPVAETERFYDEGHRDWPKEAAESQSFDMWLDFLDANSGLVQRTGDQVAITMRGREFLKWRIEAGKTEPSI